MARIFMASCFVKFQSFLQSGLIFLCARMLLILYERSDYTYNRPKRSWDLMVYPPTLKSAVFLTSIDLHSWDVEAFHLVHICDFHKLHLGLAHW